MEDTKKYYKTVITVTVLSEYEPVSTDMGLEDVAYQIVHGDWSGHVQVADGVELTGKEAADALTEQGSDPSFFMLNEDGTSTDKEV